MSGISARPSVGAHGDSREAVPRDRSRVLVAVTYGFSVRYVLSTGLLDRLAQVAEPVVALGWDDDELVRLLEERGVEVVRLPDARLDHDFRMYRRRLDLVHQRRLRSPSAAIERRQRQALTVSRSQRAISQARHLLDLAVVRSPGGARRVEADERAQVERGTNVADYAALLDRVDVDAVMVVTPYHEQDTLLLLAARDAAVSTVVSVISFDNPTTRRRMPAAADRVLVWNELNRAELLRSYPWLTPDRVRVTGAPQFDLHHRRDLVADDADWRRQLGLPTDRPVILYGGGPPYLVPQEPRLVELLDGAIDRGELPEQPYLLVRRHPAADPAPWHDLAGRLRHGVVVDPWAPGSTPDRGWPDRADLVALMSSLAHSAVHVNVCSSMTLDGAVFDRPQIGPRFVPGLDRAAQRRVRDLYEREHWWPITRSGGLVAVDDPDQLIDAVRRALTHPEQGREGRRRMVEELLTHTDGCASQRVVAEVDSELAERMSP